MGLTDSYAYFLPIHALYQIVSIKLCHNFKMKASASIIEYKSAKAYAPYSALTTTVYTACAIIMRDNVKCMKSKIVKMI